MRVHRPTTRTTLALTAAVLAAGTLTGVTTASASGGGPDGDDDAQDQEVSVDVLAPGKGDNAGIGGRGWFVDLEVDYPGGDGGLDRAGFTGLQLTGPAGHNNVAPFPGTFSPGRDDRLPGLVVLVSTTSSALPGLSGPGTNLANLFNVTGVTDRSDDETEIWDTWIVGAPIAGTDVDAELSVAVVDDLNGNGVYDDAPNVVADTDGDGDVDEEDLEALGLASKVETVKFHISS